MVSVTGNGEHCRARLSGYQESETNRLSLWPRSAEQYDEVSNNKGWRNKQSRREGPDDPYSCVTGHAVCKKHLAGGVITEKVSVKRTPYWPLFIGENHVTRKKVGYSIWRPFRQYAQDMTKVGYIKRWKTSGDTQRWQRRSRTHWASGGADVLCERQLWAEEDYNIADNACGWSVRVEKLAVLRFGSYITQMLFR